MSSSLNLALSKKNLEISEFLINYQGGFVKRGLLGEALWLLCVFFKLKNPYHLILFFSFFTFVTLVFLFFYFFKKRKFNYYFLPFPFFLGYPIITNTLVSKNTFILLLFFVIIFLSKKRFRTRYLLINFILIIGLLSHEIIGFLIFPTLFLIHFNDIKRICKKRIKVLMKFIYKLFPSIITFFAILFSKKNGFVLNKIWDSWKEFNFFNEENIKLLNNIKEKKYIFIRGNLEDFFIITKNDIYAPFLYVLVVFSCFLILMNLDKLKYSPLGNYKVKMFNKKNFLRLLYVQLLALIPIFIIGVNFGDFLFYWVCSSLILLLLEVDYKTFFLVTTFEDKIVKSVTKVNLKIILIISLILGFPISLAQETLYSFIHNSAFIYSLKFLSLIINIFLKVIFRIF
jgi:hypothetical protein